MPINSSRLPNANKARRDPPGLDVVSLSSDMIISSVHASDSGWWLLLK
jgi:hypothetical protein